MVQCFLSCLYGEGKSPKGFYDPYGEDYRFFCALPEEVRRDPRNFFLCVKDTFVRDVTQKVRDDLNLYFYYHNIQGKNGKFLGETILFSTATAFVTFPARAAPADKKVWIVVRMRGGPAEGQDAAAEIVLDGNSLGQRVVGGKGLFSSTAATERREYIFPAVLTDQDPHRIEVRLLNRTSNPEVLRPTTLFIWSVAVLLKEPAGGEARMVPGRP
jgi:hypothetical protein